MINCPHCQQQIENDSKWCRFCGKAVDSKVRWFFRSPSLIVGFLVVGPFILPAIWFHPTMKRITKLILTAVVLILTYVLTKYTIEALKTIVSYYGTALGI